jgi:hypothetical protein
MAKKKKKAGSRRRRVGAFSPSSTLMKAGSVAVGYFLAAKPVNDLIDKVVKGKVDDKIVGAGQTGLGAFLLLFKKPNLIKTVAGGVVAGSGLKRVIEAFKAAPPATPAVTGYQSVPAVGGYGNVPAVGAYNPGGMVGNYRPGSRVGRGVVGAMN